ncbi:inositol 1,4,5-triphosphate receptor associated 1 isoform X2 [Narcine bancroftii]|uniref:inositol 1,4,5-triphosphate receptor associated 1 isoform X2 n=1 Tax=Narcine bancroftii TaxID=1343680 RepID=UPI0038319FFB
MPLLDALNLEPSQSRLLFGIHEHFRPPSLDQNRGEEEKPSPSKEPLSEGRGSHTTGRNNVGGTRSQEVDEEQRVSPGTEAQLPGSVIPEDDDSSPSSCLRQQLTNFTFPGLDPSCRTPGSLPRGPRCVVAPSMPTLPEEEEGSEHRESAQRSKSNVPASAARMNSTPAIVLPEVTGPSVRDFDQAAHIRCHSPIQRRSNRNSKASSASSLTSVDGEGRVYDLVNDELPDVELSDEDKKKNAELLEEAKKISESFLNRRHRHSRASLGDSPPARTPTTSPSPSRSNSITRQQHIELEVPAVSPPPQPAEEPRPPLIRDKEIKKHTRKLSPTRKTIEIRKLSPGSAGSWVTASGKVVGASVQQNNTVSLEPRPRSESKPLDNNGHGTHTKGTLSASSTQAAPDCKALPGRHSQPQVSDLRAPQTDGVQNPPRSRAPCRAEIKSLSSQPLLRAISWECLELDGELKAPPSPPIQAAESFGFSDVLEASQLKASNCKELPTQPKLQKLTKLREENKLMRNQNLAGQRLPDLSEITEQDRGPSPDPSPAPDGSTCGSDIMPSITDSLLRKLKVQRSLPGGLPPLTEKEIEKPQKKRKRKKKEKTRTGRRKRKEERIAKKMPLTTRNTFIQLSLAFKNDSYTLETRLGLAERERNLAEDNTEKELENFRSELKSSASLWMHSDHRDAQERLLETVAVLQRLAIRLSGRAEVVGAVRQEKRMSKATEVMMQYVDNLKRMYEKDHAELAEFKKLANQNSSRSYTPYGDGCDDGVPRTARSMSLTLGKTVPRRRVSVAVLPKFINFPGQSTSNSTMTSIAPVMESNSATSTSSSESSTTPSSSSRNGQPSSLMLSPLIETKQNGDREAERLTPDVQQAHVELTRPETKAKIEEEAFNKGYQEGLKAQLNQEQKELRQEVGRAEDASKKPQEEPSVEEGRKTSKLEEVSELVVRLWPKPLKRRSVMWLVAAAVLLLAVLTSMVTSHREPCEQEAGTPGVKGLCSSGPSSPWPFSRLWHKTRAQA